MNDIIGILLGLLLIGTVAAIPISIFLSVRQSGRDWDKRKKEDEDWLAEELKKPKASIEFVTLDDVTRNTGPHDPYVVNPGSDWGYRSESKAFAERCLAGAYERGYFMDDKKNSYPACNIKTAKVIQG